MGTPWGQRLGRWTGRRWGRVASGRSNIRLLKAGEPQRWPLGAWKWWHWWSRLRSGIGSGMVYPPGYRFVHNLPNKPLTGHLIFQDLENKGDDLQDLQNAWVMVSLELWERTQA